MTRRRLVLAALVDEKTLRRYLLGAKPLRALTRKSIESAMKKLGVAHLIRPAAPIGGAP